VSEAVSRGPEAGDQGENLAAGRGLAVRGRRGRWVAAGVIVVLVSGILAAWRAGAVFPADSTSAGRYGPPPPATAVVTRRDIAATMPVTATLGYSGSWTVTGQGGGTLTRLPSAGQVIGEGQALYRIDNASPVVLLYGRVPAWRTLAVGLTGGDVRQLNRDLVVLGDADRSELAAAGWDYFSWATASGVQKLEEHLGVALPAGSLLRGQVVFEPGALRIATVPGRLGGPASGPVLTATSDRHVVTIPLDASQQSEVKAGDRVTVTLPDGTTTPGMISSVGSVAITTQSGGGVSTTIPVQVRLSDERAAGMLDQAPVTVNITTATARNVLVVPVTALLAQARGGYAVEVIGAGGARRYVPVTPGIADDASGLVQVAGGLTPGERVVVAGS
jgi:multidrug efflux pump subunit AcrA (membrane-fusion protein)